MNNIFDIFGLFSEMWGSRDHSRTIEISLESYFQPERLEMCQIMSIASFGEPARSIFRGI